MGPTWQQHWACPKKLASPIRWHPSGPGRGSGPVRSNSIHSQRPRASGWSLDRSRLRKSATTTAAARHGLRRRLFRLLLLLHRVRLILLHSHPNKGSSPVSPHAAAPRRATVARPLGTAPPPALLCFVPPKRAVAEHLVRIVSAGVEVPPEMRLVEAAAAGG